MASAPASRSSLGSRPRPRGVATTRMVAPPCQPHSLEGRNQLFNGNWSEDGWFWAGLSRQIGAADRNEADLARNDFDLTVPHVTRQAGESRELECPAVERMTRIGDSDLALAFFRDQRGITLDEVFQFRSAQSERHSRAAR